MDIPYTVQPREDTGLFNAKVGIWLFLASEVMLFGALFSSYILLRVSSPAWLYGEAKHLNVPIGTFNTGVLITSSITMVMAWASLKLRDFDKYKLFLGLTILLGFLFIVIKGFEYPGEVPSWALSRHPYFLFNLFYADGFARLARAGRHERQCLSLGTRLEDVANRSGTADEPGGGFRVVLAFRGPGLDLFVSCALLALM